MSVQHQKWLSIVACEMDKRGWNKSDLAQIVGVSPSVITELFKKGKGSDKLKLLISKKLSIRESWEKFEDD